VRYLLLKLNFSLAMSHVDVGLLYRVLETTSAFSVVSDVADSWCWSPKYLILIPFSHDLSLRRFHCILVNVSNYSRTQL